MTTKKMNSLTPEQEAMLPEIVRECVAYGKSTAPINEKATIQSAIKAYNLAGLEAPKNFEFARSPYEGMVKANKALHKTENKKEYIVPFYGQHDIGWLSFYYAFKKFGVEEVKKLDGLLELAMGAGWIWFFDELCIISERPTYLNCDDRNRLHSHTRKALEYSDGFGLYVSHGVRVPEKVIEKPEELTVEEIENEQNAEVRRVMIERFGPEKYLEQSGAKEIHRDKFGILLRKEIPNDEPLVMVKLKNSTPEPDGSVKDYYLRVPPEMTTAHQAVAWTFGLTPAEYNPAQET